MEEGGVNLALIRLDLMRSAYLAIALVPALGAVLDESVVGAGLVDIPNPRSARQAVPFDSAE